MKIEPTPVMVMVGPSSSTQMVGLLRVPAEGSGDDTSRSVVPWQRDAEGTEGSGWGGRPKREYSLEDFLVWLPSSGDGPTEEWQHRPRDTSWMKDEFVTTTVFLTTTVYTTVFQSPFSPYSITPSVTTPILPTKLPGNPPNALEGNPSSKNPDKGGGKELGDGSSLPSSVTTSNNIHNTLKHNHTDILNHPQNDHPQSGSVGNTFPESTKVTGDTTKIRGEKTNYITVTRTITTPPPTVYTARPPTVTTTTTLTESIDITDLVRPSIEYPGPSVTFSPSSATPSLSLTPSLSSTQPPSLMVTTRPSIGVISTLPSSVGNTGQVSPTITLHEGTVDGEESLKDPQATPELPITATTQAGINNLVTGATTSPNTDYNEGKQPKDISLGVPVNEENEGTNNLTDNNDVNDRVTQAHEDVSVSEGTTELSSDDTVSETVTEKHVDAPNDDMSTEFSHTILVSEPITDFTTESTSETLVTEATTGIISNISTNSATGIKIFVPFNETSLEDPIAGTMTTVPQTSGQEFTFQTSPDEHATEVTADTNIIFVGVGITESSIDVPVDEVTTPSRTTSLSESSSNTYSVIETLQTDVLWEFETTTIPEIEDSIQDSATDFAEATVTPPFDLLTPSDPEFSPSDTFRPLSERNSTLIYETELTDLTTPKTERNDSDMWGIDTGDKAVETDENINGTDTDHSDSNDDKTGVLFNASDTESGTQLPEDDSYKQDATEDSYTHPSIISDPESDTISDETMTVTSSFPGLSVTTESVEVVDPTPVIGKGDKGVSMTDSEDNATVWEVLTETPSTAPPVLITSGGDAEENTSTSIFNGSEVDSREPFVTDFPITDTDSFFPTEADGNGSGSDTVENTTTSITFPEVDESGIGFPQDSKNKSEAPDVENGSGLGTGTDDEESVSSKEGVDVPDESTDSYPDDNVSETTVISPSKTVPLLSSSGIEESMSVVLIEPSRVTTPLSDDASELPDLVVPSLYPPELTPVSTNTSEVDTEPVTSFPSPSPESSRDKDSTNLTDTDTDTTESEMESTSTPTAITFDVFSPSPSLDSSQETLDEDSVINSTTHTASLPTVHPDVDRFPKSKGENVTVKPSAAPETSVTTDEVFTVTTLTSGHVTTTSTTPVSVTVSSSSKGSDITTTLPIIQTTAESTNISCVTQVSHVTMPSEASEETTGPQLSPPSPSNNSTVPLDQRYWVRTVLEGPPYENSTLYWSDMEEALTNTYRLAYERELARQESNKASNRDVAMAIGSTISPSGTTNNPYENYTTIIARVRRDVPQSPDSQPTQPTATLLAENDVRTNFRFYKIAPGLVRKKILIPLYGTNVSKDMTVPKTNSKQSVMNPSNGRPHSRRKRWREWLAEHKFTESEHSDTNNHLWMKRRLNSNARQSASVNEPHSRLKRTAAADVTVRLHNVTYDNSTDQTELVYTVFDGNEPVLAREAVDNMTKVSDMEVAATLGQVVVVKAEEYLQSPSPPPDSNMVYGIIGAVVGGVALLVLLFSLSIFLYKRHKRQDEQLQPDSEAPSPRSQMSTNAYSGHLNLAFASSRDEKLEAVPSTSRALEDATGRASPCGSQEGLITKTRRGTHTTAAPSSARTRRYLQHSLEEEEEEEEDRKSRGESNKEEEDYETTEEEVTDGRRPKSGVSWRRGGGTGRRLARTKSEEPVYSSPNPANIQYHPSHSTTTCSKYDTTHSELTTSDLRYDPSQQLMANMIHSTAIFTNKDQGSVFLPPPLLPPPHGFEKTQDSPFIPGTSLPRFLPPPRVPKLSSPNNPSDGPSSRIQAYDYDPEAPPIPPRNYTREEAGLPPLGQRALMSPVKEMKDAQVEARESDTTGPSGSSEEQGRRPSATSSHLSDSGGSSGSLPNVGRLRRRFHDLLDDAFSLLNGQRPGDRVTPLTTPSPPRRSRSRSAALQHRVRAKEVLEEEEGPSTSGGGRPWSAAAVIHTSPTAWRDNQVVGVIPLEESTSKSPRSAWGDGAGAGRHGAGRSAGRPASARPGSGRSARSITPVNQPPPTSPDHPDGARPPSSSYSHPGAGVLGGQDEPLDPDTGLKVSDPAVPLIRAIKDELKRFKSSISTESSTA